MGKQCKLMVHGHEFHNGQEIVLNPEIFPDIKEGDCIEVFQPGHERDRLILQVETLVPVKGNLQVSILKDVASQFLLDSYMEISVQKVDKSSAVVDFIELNFKDQYISRADIWRYKVAMFGKALFTSKNLQLLGIRAQVKAMMTNGRNVHCGVVGTDTKLILRSRSGRIFWLIQMGTEMWEFDSDGEVYYEKLLNRLINVLFERWQNTAASHSVTIILFSRSYYAKSQFPSDFDPKNPIFSNFSFQGHGPGRDIGASAGYGPTIHLDSDGNRYYEDFYQVVAQDLKNSDWGTLLHKLKREIMRYFKVHRWRLPEENIKASYHYRTVNDTDGKIRQLVVWDEMPRGLPSRSVDGNVLEAINVVLNMMDKHFMDRDLNRTGQSIVFITAGCGVFKVEKHLSQITKQRMMDNGIGMDMISLGVPPFHAVPLFLLRAVDIIRSDSASAVEYYGSFHGDGTDIAKNATRRYQYRVFSIPHWISMTFLSLECHCEYSTGISGLRGCSCVPRKAFRPLPPFRMFDLTSPEESQMFPIALRNMISFENTTQVAGETKSNKEFNLQNSFSDTINETGLVDQLVQKLSSDVSYVGSLRMSKFAPVMSDGLSRGLVHSISTGSLRPTRYTSRSIVDIVKLGKESNFLDDKRKLYEEFQRYDEAVFQVQRPACESRKSYTKRPQSRKGSNATLADSSTEGAVSIQDINRTSPEKAKTLKRDINTPRIPSKLHSGRTRPPVPKIGSKKVSEIHLSRSFENRKQFMRPPPSNIWNNGKGGRDSGDTDTTVDGPNNAAYCNSSSGSFASSQGRSAENGINSEFLEQHQTRLKKGSLSGSSRLKEGLMTPTVGSKHDENVFFGSDSPADNKPLPEKLRLISSRSNLSKEANGPVNIFQTRANENSFRLTSNRRRWMHLFPTSQSQSIKRQLHNGLHWASLTCPASLPLTTDYYPSPSDLHTMYTESFYALTLSIPGESDVPAYKSHKELVDEMVCQRLSQDFQLVATEAEATPAFPAAKGVVNTKRGPGGERQEPLSHSIVYHLSMGHRIHQIIYDEELQTIEVKRYVRRFSGNEENEVYPYRYSLWVPQTKSFHPSRQDFSEFSSPECNWNFIDQLLCGYYDHMPESTKCRRIRFCIVPPKLGNNILEERSYLDNFNKFIENLQSRLSEHDKISVAIQSCIAESTKLGDESPSGWKPPTESFKVSLGSPYNRQEWLILQTDTVHRTDSCFNFDIHWLACSGSVVDDFVSSLYRKSKQFGVELRRVPEFSRSTFLQLHPLLAPIYLPLPENLVLLVQKALLSRFDFIFDDERLTDQKGLGLGLGIEEAVRPSQSSLPYQKYRLTVEDMMKKRRARGYRQYMHRKEPVFVRVIHSGIVWIPGYAYEREGRSPNTSGIYNSILCFIEALLNSYSVLQDIVAAAEEQISPGFIS